MGGGQLILGSVATLLGVGTLWLLKWVDFVVLRGHRATLVMVGDHNWTLMAELPKLLAKLHCRTRFPNRTQSLESGKAEYAFEIVWKLPERATPPIDLLRVLNERYDVKSLELYRVIASRAPAYGQHPSAERVFRHHHRDGFRYHDGRAVGRALAGKLGIGSAHRREKPAREKRPEDRL